MSAYDHFRSRRAWEITRSFWSVHQVLAFLAPAVSVVLFAFWKRYLGQGANSLISTAILALWYAVLVYIACWVGSFLINYIWAAPATLHEEQEKTIKKLNACIKSLTEQPTRTPAEEHCYQEAKVALEELGDTGVTVLRHLMMHERLTFGQFDPPLPEKVNKVDTLRILQMAVEKNLSTRYHVPRPEGPQTVFEIAPGMRSALEQNLY